MVGLKLNFRPIDFAKAHNLMYSSTPLNNGNRLVAMTSLEKNFTHWWEINKEGNLVSARAATDKPDGPLKGNKSVLGSLINTSI